MDVVQEEAFSLDDQFLYGSSILVAPVSEAGASSRDVYLPTSIRWYITLLDRLLTHNKHVRVACVTF